MRSLFMKSTKKLLLLTLVAVFIILEAMPTYASRLVYLDKVETEVLQLFGAVMAICMATSLYRGMQSQKSTRFSI